MTSRKDSRWDQKRRTQSKLIGSVLLLLLVILVPLYLKSARDPVAPSSVVKTVWNTPPKSPTRPADVHLSNLKRADRFTEYAPGDKYRDAQEQLNDGDIGAAYNIFTARNALEDSERDKRFDAVLEIAFQEWSSSSQASDFVERIETYWRPDLNALPSAFPVTAAVGWELLNKLDEFSEKVADGERMNLTVAQHRQLASFARALSNRQLSLYPELRKAVASGVGKRLFRDDIAVATSGTKSEVLRLTSPAFVRNAAVDDVQRSANQSLMKARFHRIEYRWSAYHNDGHHYNLSVPADNIVAIWNASAGRYDVVPAR